MDLGTARPPRSFSASFRLVGLIAAKLRTPEQTDTWVRLVIAALTQLVLARDLAADLRRPWEKPPRTPATHPRTGPSRVSEHPLPARHPGLCSQTKDAFGEPEGVFLIEAGEVGTPDLVEGEARETRKRQR